MARIQHYETYLAGVRHKNQDGSSRQRLIQKLEVGDCLILEHESDNQFDKNAIRVLRSDHRQVGYLPRDIAADVHSKAKRGYDFACFVWGEGFAGDERTTSHFIDLLLVESPPGTSRRKVLDYFRRHNLPDLDEAARTLKRAAPAPKRPARQSTKRSRRSTKRSRGCLGTAIMAAIIAVVLFVALILVLMLVLAAAFSLMAPSS